MHGLLSLTVPLTLVDDVALEDAGPLPGPDVLEVEDAMGLPAVPTDPALAGPGSLALRAVAAYRGRTGWPARRIAVRVVKRIPYCAGLGGASSDAAAALALLDSLAPAPLGPAGLAALALPLGADVPFFLEGPGPRIVRGVGEILSPYEGPPLPPFAALAGPGTGLPTGEVFREYELTKAAPGNSVSSLAVHGAPSHQPGLGENDLLPAALRLSPALSGLERDVVRVSSGPFGMSGSGPTFWALYRDAGRAEEAAARLRGLGRWSTACGLALG
jgi:4-diphosphocytidyl-2-C-methyl-D-erythritol kinase